MFFEQESVAFLILDVVALDQESTTMHNTKRNFNALSFRLSANAVIECQGESYDLTDGSVLFMPANLDYTRTCQHDELIAIHFVTFGPQNDKIESFYPKEPQAYTALFQRAHAIWNAQEVGYRQKTSAVLYEILAKIYAENNPDRLRNSAIEGGVAYLNANYKSPTLSIKDAAAASFMCESYFRRLFHRMFGISPKAYIIDRRLRFAAALIQTGYYRLNEVAAASGFIDYKYFSAEFKRHFGVSPSQYTYNYHK